MKYFKNLFLLLISVTLIIVFQGCNKSPTGSEGENTDEIKISEKTEVLHDSTISKIDHVSGDSIIYFNKNAQEMLQLEEGDIIVSSAGEGFLRKVKETEEEGNYIVVRTEYAALEDAIEKGNLVISNKTLNFDGMRTKSKLRGVRFKSRGDLLEVDFNSLIYKDPKTGTEIRGVGKSVFGAVIDTMRAEFLFGLQSFKFGFKIYHSESLGIEITDGCSFGGKIKLASFTLNPILVPVGILIVIIPHVDLYIGANLNVQASVSTSVQKDDTIMGGITYSKAQGWSTFSDYKKSFSYSPPSVSSSGEAEIYAVVPEISLQVYELIGPYAEMKGYGKIEVNPLSNPWWTLYAGFDVSGGVKFEVLAWNVKWGGSIYSKEWEIANSGSSNSSPNTPNTPAGPSTGDVGTSYSFSTSTTDPDGDNVACQFDWGDGNLSSWSSYVSSGTSVSMNHSYSSTGTYSVKAKAKDESGAESGWSSGHSIEIKVSGGNSGTQKWAFSTGDYVWSSPAIGSDGTIYVGSYDCNLYAINPDGSQKWAFSTGSEVSSSPAIGSDGTIYVGSYDCNLYAINPNGTEKWAFSTGGYVSSSPAIGTDGTIYVGSNDYNLYAINPDGSQKWAFSTGDWVKSSPAIGSDGTIYVGSYDCNLYATNPDGTQKWAFSTGDWVYSSPAIGSDGTIYVGSRDKKLYAIYGSSGGLANTPWPMFHHDLKHSGRAGGP